MSALKAPRTIFQKETAFLPSIQSDLMGAYALGMRNLLCLTGDHQIFGNHPTSKNVFDIDSILPSNVFPNPSVASI